MRIVGSFVASPGVQDRRGSLGAMSAGKQFLPGRRGDAPRQGFPPEAVRDVINECAVSLQNAEEVSSRLTAEWLRRQANPFLDELAASHRSLVGVARSAKDILKSYIVLIGENTRLEGEHRSAREVEAGAKRKLADANKELKALKEQHAVLGNEVTRLMKQEEEARALLRTKLQLQEHTNSEQEKHLLALKQENESLVSEARTMVSNSEARVKEVREHQREAFDRQATALLESSARISKLNEEKVSLESKLGVAREEITSLKLRSSAETERKLQESVASSREAAAKVLELEKQLEAKRVESEEMRVSLANLKENPSITMWKEKAEQRTAAEVDVVARLTKLEEMIAALAGKPHQLGNSSAPPKAGKPKFQGPRAREDTTIVITVPRHAPFDAKEHLNSLCALPTLVREAGAVATQCDDQEKWFRAGGIFVQQVSSTVLFVHTPKDWPKERFEELERHYKAREATRELKHRRWSLKTGEEHRQEQLAAKAKGKGPAGGTA